MDELARRYLALGLRIGRHIDGYVDGYTGPAELREAIEGEAPAPPQELHVEAVALHELAAELPNGAAHLARRRRWLEDQLVAMSATCRTLAGEEIAYVDLVEALYEVPAAPEPDETFASAHRALDEVLTPGESLRSRLLAYDASTQVPPELVLPAIESVVALLRRRTADDLWLPRGEAVDWVAEHDKPWGAYARYEGGLRTRIEVNLDLPRNLAGIVYLAAHEAYPGHHTERATKEALLAGDPRSGEPGFGETGIACLFAPEAAISEGLADVAREVVMTDQELSAELRSLARRLNLPIEAAAIERSVPVSRARQGLRSASVNVALKVFHEGRPLSEVRAWLADVALMSDLRIDHELRTLDRGPLWATYPFTYHLAPTLIRPWLEVQGQTHGLARLLAEQLSPPMLRADLAVERALYPGDLV